MDAANTDGYFGDIALIYAFDQELHSTVCARSCDTVNTRDRFLLGKEHGRLNGHKTSQPLPFSSLSSGEKIFSEVAMLAVITRICLSNGSELRAYACIRCLTKCAWRA
jgi:hypothetical protein